MVTIDGRWSRLNQNLSFALVTCMIVMSLVTCMIALSFITSRKYSHPPLHPFFSLFFSHLLFYIVIPLPVIKILVSSFSIPIFLSLSCEICFVFLCEQLFSSSLTACLYVYLLFTLLSTQIQCCYLLHHQVFTSSVFSHLLRTILEFHCKRRYLNLADNTELFHGAILSFKNLKKFFFIFY